MGFTKKELDISKVINIVLRVIFCFFFAGILSLLIGGLPISVPVFAIIFVISTLLIFYPFKTRKESNDKAKDVIAGVRNGNVQKLIQFIIEFGAGYGLVFFVPSLITSTLIAGIFNNTGRHCIFQDVAIIVLIFIFIFLALISKRKALLFGTILGAMVPIFLETMGLFNTLQSGVCGGWR